jgi:sulfur carrier protein
MAAAVNLNVIKKENWNTYELKDNDNVELLRFVGGGGEECGKTLEFLL